MHMFRTKNHKAEYLGQLLGYGWRWLKQKDASVLHWLKAKQLPLANILLRLTQFVFLGLLLYITFWFVLFICIFIFGAWVFNNNDISKITESELRDGHSGVGTYKDDLRVDLGDPDDP